MEPKISIIIPIYNVEPYLSRCLDSVLSQTMKEIEVLLIDDGSTDKSGKICDSYALFDERVVVVHQKNCGTSCARNVGLKLSSCKYIMFVDPDDYVEKDFCEVPYNIAIKNNADIVMFNNWIIDINGVWHQRIKPEIEDGLVDKRTAIKLLTKYVNVVPWNKLYVRELFDTVTFPEGRLFEDNATTYKLVLKSDKIYYTHLDLYIYCVRENSISRKLNHTDFIEMYSMMYDDLKDAGYKCYVRTDIFLLSLRYLTYFGLTAKYSENCKRIISGFDNFESVNLETKTLLFIYKTSPLLFDFICYLFGKRQKPENF